jgi:hypothetical protein
LHRKLHFKHWNTLLNFLLHILYKCCGTASKISTTRVLCFDRVIAFRQGRSTVLRNAID